MIAPPVIWYGLSRWHYFIILFIIVAMTIWDTLLYTYSQRVAITFLLSLCDVCFIQFLLKALNGV